MIGEQVFDACGQRWTLYLGNAAQCAIEEQYEKGFFAVIADAMPQVSASTALLVSKSLSEDEDSEVILSDDEAAEVLAATRGLKLSVLRDLAWHGLIRHHPTITLDVVSELTDALGQAAFGELIGKAIRSTQDKGGSGVEGEGRPTPKKSATRSRGATGRR